MLGRLRVTISDSIDSIPHLSAGKKATLDEHVQSQEFGVSLDANCDEVFQEYLQENPPATFKFLQGARLKGARLKGALEQLGE